MREAAIKAILLSYYRDLEHSDRYKKLAKKIRTDDSLDNVLKSKEWVDYEFEKPALKSRVIVYGKRKNACFEISSFERTSLNEVVVYIINRRRLVIPLKNVDVKIVSGHLWKNKNETIVKVEATDIQDQKENVLNSQ